MAMGSSDTNPERPQRLLHVPTMCSETWDSVLAKSDRPPTYNALSYTWGRFTSKDLPLKVGGISWQVPGIHPSHFTAAEFHHLLTVIAPESGYVWVDIACIDQEYLPMKMEEIGKQADIFRGAERTFIWLTTHTRDSLAQNYRTLMEFGELLMSLQIDLSNLSYNKKTLQNILDTGLSNALDAAQKIFRDPWFTSLWALQEAYLRPDATILTKDGHSIDTSSKTPVDLELLSAYVQEIYIGLPPASSMSPTAQALLNCFHRSGLMGIDTFDVPVHIYPAAHARQCENDVDRVYAIMQVYRLRLGSARYPHRVYTPEELEDELVQSLNRLSPLAAQLFLHQSPPMANRAWMITRVCVLPPTYFMVGSIENLCTIDATQQQPTPIYKGRECTLEDMVRCWAASIDQRNNEYLHHINPNYKFHHYSADIDLDAGHLDERSRPMFFRLMEERLPTCPCAFCRRGAQPFGQLGLATRVQELLPCPISQYRLLEIANIATTTSLSSGGSYRVSCSLGILGTTEQDGDRKFFRRVGICCWEKAQAELISVYNGVWTAAECCLA
ncbi:heterokaryon incompatibility protein-domain-containing protein [Aspergillus pseudoustus]|uniref:Heterokaryon incompatibility protein-domain-containing protein n=1 Tax=Aspergillus pseudoustus TaxID=1810923 RepID=A0ABR4J0C1_9EURO